MRGKHLQISDVQFTCTPAIGSLQSLDWTSGLDWWTGGLTFFCAKITIVLSAET